MTIERIVRMVAGIFILLSLSLGVEGSPLFHHQNWLWFTAFVGFNLLQSSFTQFCPLEMILKKLGVKSSCQQ
ncbi:MAG: sulfurtransferase [Methylobacter sp.]|nr:MAG: sulfurtransferase [Methylobacter sp.]